MTGARKVRLVVNAGKIVYVEGEACGEGAVIEVPPTDAKALVAEGLATKA